MELVVAKIRTINGERIALDYKSEQEGVQDVTILDYVDNWSEGEKMCKFWSKELGISVFDNSTEYQI